MNPRPRAGGEYPEGDQSHTGPNVDEGALARESPDDVGDNLRLVAARQKRLGLCDVAKIEAYAGAVDELGFKGSRFPSTPVQVFTG